MLDKINKSVVDILVSMSDLDLLRECAFIDYSDVNLSRDNSVKDLRDLFIGMVNCSSANVVFEIGAKEATFSRSVKRQNPNQRIIAFEANPHNFALYSSGRSGDELKKQSIEYIHNAVSDVSGVINFNLKETVRGEAVSKNAGGHSILRRSSSSVTYESCSVPSVSMNDFINSNGLSGEFVAWIDVEGCASKVLEGIGHQINNFSMFLIEVEDKEYWAGQKLRGDIMDFMVGRGFLPICRDFQGAHQNNIIFVTPAVLRDNHLVRFEISKYYSKRASQFRSNKGDLLAILEKVRDISKRLDLVETEIDLLKVNMGSNSHI